MLITLNHLLVIVGLFTSGSLGFAFLAAGSGLQEERHEGLVVLCGFLSGFLAMALLGWPVFRLLSLRPLILPMCPHCERRHCNYHVPRDAWPAAILLCAWCGKPLRLVLRTGADPVPPSDVPTITLRRPGFLGLWRKADLTS